MAYKNEDHALFLTSILRCKVKTTNKKMKYKQPKLFYSICLVSLCLFQLGNTTQPDNSNKEQESPLVFHTREFSLKYVDILAAWNKKFPTNKIEEKATDKSIVFSHLAIPFEESRIADLWVESMAIEPTNPKEFERDKSRVIEIVKGNSDIPGLIPAFNDALGYHGSVSIYFKPDEKEKVKEALEATFPTIYGLNLSKEANKSFDAAIKKVYGEKGKLIFTNIAVVPEKTNLDNLKDNLNRISRKSIADSETDLGLKELKKAIDAYNEKKDDPELLEKVKEAWLYQLKGDESLSQSNNHSGWLKWVLITICIMIVLGIMIAIYAYYRRKSLKKNRWL